MPEVVVEQYGPVQVLEHTGGQYLIACPTCQFVTMRSQLTGGLLTLGTAKEDACDHYTRKHFFPAAEAHAGEEGVT